MTARRVLWVSTSTETRGGVASFVRTMQQTALWRDWHIGHIATHRDGSVLRRAMAYPPAVLRFVGELLFRRPDIVHVHMASYGSFYRKSLLVWIAGVLRVPVVLHVHGAEFHAFHAGSFHLIQRYIRATLDSASIVVALGNVWARRLAAITSAQIIVVPNAVRPQSAVRRPDDGGPVRVLFLGQVGERKGAFVLLDAWAKAAVAAGVAAELTIAGDGAVQRARARVAELGLGQQVRVIGWIDAADVTGLLSDSHILVLPSRNEGQPMSILEAMSHGLCVVASDTGGIPDLVDETCGVLVPVDDVDALASALERVIADAALRERLGAAALQRVRDDFDVDVVSGRFDEIYRSLVSDHRGGGR